MNVLLLVLWLWPGATSGDECQNIANQCRSVVTEDDLGKHREVSCTCVMPQVPKDVYRSLEELQRASCPAAVTSSAPKYASTLLRMNGCDVSEHPFPEGLYLDLLQSRSLRIDITDTSVRMPQAHGSPTNDHPFIYGDFLASKINGLRPGQFNQASGLNLTFRNCIIDVIEAGTFSGFPVNASVDLIFLDNEISTLKNSAFQLPEKSSVTVSGATVKQWESFGFCGGSYLNVTSLNIHSLQTYAINIYGLQEFRLESNSIASMQSQCIENTLKEWLNRPPNLKTKKVIIRKNEFMKVSGTSLVNLCNVEQLVVENNFFVIIVTPPLTFRNERCQAVSIQRTFWKNGLYCSRCDARPALDSDVCMFLKSSWCSLDISTTNDSSRAPHPLYMEFMNEKCPKEFSVIEGGCQKFYPEGPIVGRQLGNGAALISALRFCTKIVCLFSVLARFAWV